MRDVPGQRTYLTGPIYSSTGNAIAAEWYMHGTFNSDGYFVVVPSRRRPRNRSDAASSTGISIGTGGGRTAARLLEAGDDGAHVSLWSATIGGQAKKIDLGDVNFGNDGQAGKNGGIAFVGNTPSDPGELYYLASPEASVRKLTNFNSAIEALHLGAMREVTRTGPGGFAADGILTTPPDFDASKKYPLAVEVHGGPQGNGFAELRQSYPVAGGERRCGLSAQLSGQHESRRRLSARHLSRRRRRTGQRRDGRSRGGAQTRVRRCIAHDGIRLVVCSGYMTSWLSGHYPVWKAAVAGAALNDYPLDYTISWYQEGDAADFFGGGPYDPRTKAMWIEQSPLTYAARVTAPTLIMGDVGDPNVPIINSYEMYHALKDHGVTVQFIAYPLDVHFPNDPVRQADVDRRWIAWLEKYAK